MGRAPCCNKANLKRGPWSPEEDTPLSRTTSTNLVLVAIGSLSPKKPVLSVVGRAVV